MKIWKAGRPRVQRLDGNFAQERDMQTKTSQVPQAFSPSILTIFLPSNTRSHWFAGIRQKANTARRKESLSTNETSR
jgi:hypothetical protein